MAVIKAFLDERAEDELKRVFYFAQPNGFNANFEKSFSDFKKELINSNAPARTTDDIMSEVRGILAAFS